MTEELGPWSLAIGGGAAVAVLYLTSLWWTVARVARTRHPARLVAVSYLLRAPIAALALFAVAAGDAPRLLAASRCPYGGRPVGAQRWVFGVDEMMHARER